MVAFVIAAIKPCEVPQAVRGDCGEREKKVGHRGPAFYSFLSGINKCPLHALSYTCCIALYR
jgi:hypothetical protein